MCIITGVAPRSEDRTLVFKVVARTVHENLFESIWAADTRSSLQLARGLDLPEAQMNLLMRSLEDSGQSLQYQIGDITYSGHPLGITTFRSIRNAVVFLGSRAYQILICIGYGPRYIIEPYQMNEPSGGITFDAVRPLAIYSQDWSF